MKAKKRIFIVEDHQLFRDGLKALVKQGEEWELSGEAADGLEALRLVPTCAPDLVLLDLSMPRVNGFLVLRELKGLMPKVKVLVLSIHESDHYVLQAFQSDADGYALKDSSREELRFAIHSVLEGKKYISPGISKNVVEGYVTGGEELKSKQAF